MHLCFSHSPKICVAKNEIASEVNLYLTSSNVSELISSAENFFHKIFWDILKNLSFAQTKMFVSGSSSFYQANKSTFANYSHIHICSINLVFQTCSILNVDTCFIYIIGTINLLDKQLFLPYCICLSYFTQLVLSFS